MRIVNSLLGGEGELLEGGCLRVVLCQGRGAVPHLGLRRNNPVHHIRGMGKDVPFISLESHWRLPLRRGRVEVDDGTSLSSHSLVEEEGSLHCTRVRMLCGLVGVLMGEGNLLPPIHKSGWYWSEVVGRWRMAP